MCCSCASGMAPWIPRDELRERLRATANSPGHHIRGINRMNECVSQATDMDEDEAAAGTRMYIMPDAAQQDVAQHDDSQAQGHTSHSAAVYQHEAGAAGGSPAAESEGSAHDLQDLTGGLVYDPWRCKFTPRVCACMRANAVIKCKRSYTRVCMHAGVCVCACGFVCAR